jgi:glycosyltransferase involved in cell wall biosynthesis
MTRSEMQSTITERTVKTSQKRRAPLRVYMMDLLSTVPYYTGTLCKALKDCDAVDVTVGSITYYLDRDLFHRYELRTDSALLDLVSRVSGAAAPVRRGLKLLEYAVNLTVLGLRLRLQSPDILHVQFLPGVKFGLPIELWFLRMVRSSGTKVVYTVHNVLPQDTGRKYFDRYKWLYHRADRLVCHTEWARDQVMNEFGVDRAKISMIPHGPLLSSISTCGPDEVRSSLGISEQECLVLCPGILRPYKGIPFLLDSWAQVRSAGIKARLTVVGEGDATMKRAVREQVEALAIQRSVHLDLRFVAVEELAAYHEAADIIVYPYKEITTSGALMTGIGYGKAIIATRQPAFEQLLSDGRNAMLVDYGDVEGFANTLVRLIEDRPLRLRLGNQARQDQSKRPQWPAIAKQTARCYQEAMCSR